MSQKSTQRSAMLTKLTKWRNGFKNISEGSRILPSISMCRISGKNSKHNQTHKPVMKTPANGSVTKNQTRLVVTDLVLYDVMIKHGGNRRTVYDFGQD